MDRQWRWIADMNLDGVVTVRDLGVWLHWLFFYPGDYFIYISFEYGQLAQFFELAERNYGGLFPFAISSVTWITLWMTPKLIARRYRAAREDREWEKKLRQKLSVQERRREWTEKKDRKRTAKRRQSKHQTSS